MRVAGNRSTVRVLFVHNYLRGEAASFVQQDLELLRETYQVEELSMRELSAPRGPFTSLRLWQAVRRSDLIVGWFGTVGAPVVLMAWTLRRPSVLIGGGADVVDLPEINYGLNAIRPRLRTLTLLGFRLATRVLPFSEASCRSLMQLPGVRPEQVRTLYLGVDAEHFSPAWPKLPQALTVGYISTNNLVRKGLLTFVEAAQRTPSVRYRLAGKPIDPEAVTVIERRAPSNLTYLGYLDGPQLLTEYRNARVYAQLSAHEGFGAALAEAMACECVPIVTDRGSIPEVVGDTGVYVPFNDPKASGEAIRLVIEDQMSGKRARQRIVELFPVDKRRAGLRTIIEELVSQK